MKARLLTYALIISLILSPITISHANAVPIPVKKPGTLSIGIAARSAVLVDYSSGTVMYAKNKNLRVPIASTTKIMTAVVVLEKYNLNTVVKVNSRAASISGSKMGLKKNERITVESLLWGMLLSSGNDAAFALASLASPKEPKKVMPFVKLMNAKAKKLGLRNTNYRDPSGLNDHGRSSAYDLAKLTSYAMKEYKFAEIIKTRKKNVYSVNRRTKHRLVNTNKLIQPSEKRVYMPEAIGVKTGLTDAAGQCLVAAVKFNGHILISVVLHPNKVRALESTRQSRKLLKWGMSNFEWN